VGGLIRLHLPDRERDKRREGGGKAEIYLFFTKIMFLPGNGVGAAILAEPVVKEQTYQAILRQEWGNS